MRHPYPAGRRIEPAPCSPAPPSSAARAAWNTRASLARRSPRESQSSRELGNGTQTTLCNSPGGADFAAGQRHGDRWAVAALAGVPFVIQGIRAVARGATGADLIAVLGLTGKAQLICGLAMAAGIALSG